MEALTLGYLSETCRLERHRQRLKQSDVAEKAGLSQQDVSDVERGRGTCEAVRAVALALGIEVPG